MFNFEIILEMLNDVNIETYKVTYKEAIKSNFSIGNGVMKITFDLTLH